MCTSLVYAQRNAESKPYVTSSGFAGRNIGNMPEQPAISGFGPRLRARRLARGLTQEGIAQELGVTRATVSRWESGLNAPEFQLLEPLRRLLDSSLDHLVGGAEAPPGRGISEARHPVYALGKLAAKVDPLDERLMAIITTLSRRKKVALVTLLSADRPDPQPAAGGIENIRGFTPPPVIF